jgi:endonuclease/exonuclease/phosphatase family metal-dependent hydrolase
MPQTLSRPLGSLKLATWNIHYGTGADGRLDLKRIISALGAIDADVIGLQEVGWHRRHHQRVDQFAYLREHTAYEVVEGLVRDPLRARFGNALLTRIPVRETRWIDLKVMGHVPRAALLVDLEAAATPIRVVVVHLGLTPWERERQTRRLIDEIATDEGTPPPTALMGDFNMLRASTRASRVLDEHFPVCIRRPTFPARQPTLSLDRIYLSGDWNLAEAKVFRRGPASQASDHLPLVARARFTAQELNSRASDVNIIAV